MLTLEEQLAKKEAEVAKLKAEIKKQRAQERKQVSEWRNTALLIIGKQVLKITELDWTQINPTALVDVLSRHRDELLTAKYTEPRSVKDARTDWANANPSKRGRRKKKIEDAPESADREKFNSEEPISEHEFTVAQASGMNSTVGEHVPHHSSFFTA